MLMSSIIESSVPRNADWALAHVLSGRAVVSSIGTTIVRDGGDFRVYTNKYPGTCATLHGQDVLVDTLNHYNGATFAFAPQTHVEFLSTALERTRAAVRIRSHR